MKVAVIQCRLGDPFETGGNLQRIEAGIRDAAGRGATVVLPPELFAGPYFPQREDAAFFDQAHPVKNNPLLERFGRLAGELGVVLPVSFFERDDPHYYNSVAVFDADGSMLGVYRKSHIPDGPGYEEKFYFRPGDTGFRTWTTRAGRIGVGICWDQWFPEAARAMALQGADILLYPTAIGSEPEAPDMDTCDPWRRAMIGHAVCNAIPVAAANRIGVEDGITFYGSSFIADPRGDLCASLGRVEEAVIVSELDLDTLRRERAEWGFFRDRRPDLYGPLIER